MDWEKTSHCSWDKSEMRIVQQYCPKQGGIIFKLFNGANVKIYISLAEAQAAAALKEMM